MPSSAERIVAWLREASGPLSGETLAERLGCSRAAVFKHVEALRAEGWVIEARHAAGYVLAAAPDRLGPAELAPYLTGTWRRIEWRAEVGSTQQVARDLARAGAPEGTVVVAEAQTAGRGRLGRVWHSPFGLNLYCSVVLRPALAPAAVPRLALVCGLAVAETIHATTGLVPGLKWPNDVLLDGRKVSGTLTEMEAELESVRHVIAGIGVNLNAPADAFPAGLRDRVTSLAIASRRRIDRAAFTGRLLAELERWYGRFVAEGFAPLRPAWERWSALDGATVTVSGPDGDVAGTVVGLADDGALRVAGADGRERRVVAGEVTVRRAHGPARGRRLVLPRR